MTKLFIYYICISRLHQYIIPWNKLFHFGFWPATSPHCRFSAILTYVLMQYMLPYIDYSLLEADVFLKI